MNYVIGVDIGTQSATALRVDQQGAIVAQHASSYQPDTPKPLWAEQWPAVWFKAVVECIAACVTKAKETGVAAASDREITRLNYSQPDISRLLSSSFNTT